MGQLRCRAEAHDTSSAFEGMDTAPHLLDVVLLSRGIAQAWQEAPDRVEVILSFEEEAVDQLARYLILPSGRPCMLGQRDTGRTLRAMLAEPQILPALVALCRVRPPPPGLQ